MRGFIFFTAIFLTAHDAWAQIDRSKSAKPKTDPNTISIDTTRQKTTIDMHTLDDGSVAPPRTTRRQTDVQENDQTVVSSNWARATVGLYLENTNNGIMRSAFKRTQDRTLVGHSSEFGFGFGALLDFPFSRDGMESLRLQMGVARLSVRPNAATKAAFSPSQLENSETLFKAALIYRFGLSEDLGYKTLWYGIGAQMNYIFATSRPDQGGAPASNINNSYGFSPIFAVGADLPIASFDDLVFAIHYFPLKGYALLAGFRTSL